MEANREDETSVIEMNNDDFKNNGLKPKKNPHNKTHYSPSDPDAKMSVKPGKATALNYLGEVSVDTASHMITHIQAFTSDKRDSQCLAEVIENVIENLNENELTVEEVIADTGYSSGEALKSLEENNIIGYIPNRAQFVYDRPGFTYNSEGDYYTCPNNNMLTYRGTHKDGEHFNKHYRANKKDCNACPLMSKCSAFFKKGALIKETVDRPYYIRMHQRMQTTKAKRLMKQRQSTAEPVIGTLVNYLGIKRVNTKGLAQANKCLTIAAVAYNLKKLMKHNTSRILTNVQALKTKSKQVNGILLNVFSAIKRLLQRPYFFMRHGKFEFYEAI